MGLLCLTLAFKYSVVSLEIRGIVENYRLLNVNSRKRLNRIYATAYTIYIIGSIAYLFILFARVDPDEWSFAVFASIVLLNFLLYCLILLAYLRSMRRMR
jgi:hypothetical protein